MKQILIVLMVSSLAVPAAFGKAIVYPAKGQSAKQQEKDTDECYGWAKSQTGIDPAALAEQATSQKPQERQGQVAKGAAGGAIVGGIAGDAGTGAAIGAGAGAVKKRRGRKKAEQEQQAGQAEIKQQLETFEKANTACLKGRGYTVE